MSTAPYFPMQGTLARRVVEYFQRSPDEELSAEDIAVKWAVRASDVGADLAKALEAGLLVRLASKNAAVRYAAGSQLPKATTPPAAAAPKPAGKGGRKLRLEDLPDPASIVIRNDVPIPDPRSASVTARYQATFEALQPGQSFVVPAIAMTTFKRMCGELGRKLNRRFAIRMELSGTPAIWRLPDDAPVRGRKRTATQAATPAAPAVQKAAAPKPPAKAPTKSNGSSSGLRI